MPIPDSFIDELVSRTDIVALVGGYVRLTKKSGSNMFGLCPFHSEKTPSFSVNADKQIYYCFGCGKGGGAINFVMEIENATYRDALEMLARRAGMTVPESGAPDDLAARRKRMLELNREAALHFHDMLSSPLAENAREYLAKRKISRQYVTKFGIGLAPDSWTLLYDAMLKKGYSTQDMIDAGLVKPGKEGKGAYDTFRSRLMFPVIDVRGGVIGFSGRILGDGEPKYLNSSDTLVFNKRRNLFALNLAKKSKSGILILVEGNVDVVTLHQAGFDCAVASLGTSLSEEQARLMSRYSQKAVIAYDSDEAGHKATLRAIPLLEKAGMSIKVLDLGDIHDPDDYLKMRGPDAFRVLLERSENHIEYRLMTIKRGYDMQSDEAKLAYLSEAAELVSGLDSEPEREIYGARLARETGVSPESIKNEVARRIKARTIKQKKDYDKQIARPATAAQHTDRTLRYSNEASAAAEEGIIRCLARDTTLLNTIDALDFRPDEFTSPELAKIFQLLAARIYDGRDTKELYLMSEMDAKEASLFTGILQKPEDLPNGDKSVRAYIEKVRTEKLRTGEVNPETLLEIAKRKQRG